MGDVMQVPARVRRLLASHVPLESTAELADSQRGLSALVEAS